MKDAFYPNTRAGPEKRKKAMRSLLSSFNTPFALDLALTLARWLPPRLGLPLSRLIADIVSGMQRTDLVQAVRLNQWVLGQGRLSARQLNEAVRNTVRSAACCLYDLYHNLDNLAAVRQRIELTPTVHEMIERVRTGRLGQIIVTPHLSNFDLVTLATASKELNLLLLTFPHPDSGYQRQNQVRSFTGLQVLPTSKTALRRAIEHLRNGGSVITALDRPIPESRYRLRFFGRPAHLPVHHILLALKANVPITVCAVTTQNCGTYTVSASEPIEMQRLPNRQQEITVNAEKVLSVAENFVRQAPQQWRMFYPVWPEAESELPL